MASNTYGAIKLSTAEDVGAVLKKKTGSQDGYKPKEWADTINLLGALPIRTASGTIAHFEDGADDVPMKSVVANIVPIQSGTGDPSPSNPRPISGTSVLNVTRTVKNFANIKPYSDWTVGSTYGYIDCGLPKNTRLTMSLTVKDPDVSVSGCYFGFVKSGYAGESLSTDSYRWILNNGNYNASPNTPANGDTSIFLSDLIIYPKTEATYDKIFSRFDVQIELGSTSTTYEPYTGSTYTIALGQTVYGGSADVVGGEGSKTKEEIDLGSLEWTYHPASGQYSDFFDCYLPSDSITGSSGIAFDGLCSIYKSIPSANIATSGYDNNVMALAQGTRRFIVCDQRFTSKNDFVASVTGITLVYPIATPTDFTFTGQPINSLLGVNNVWTDSGEVLDVEYRADMNLLIAELGG